MDPVYYDLLEAALIADFGIRVPSANGAALKQKLYLIRAADERFQALRITNSPSDHNEVWIVRKSAYTPTQGRYANDIWEE